MEPVSEEKDAPATDTEEIAGGLLAEHTWRHAAAGWGDSSALLLAGCGDSGTLHSAACLRVIPAISNQLHQIILVCIIRGCIPVAALSFRSFFEWSVLRATIVSGIFLSSFVCKSVS